MSGTLPSPRRVASALAVLAALPSAALADLAERLIDRLDALDGDPDREPDDDDCCAAGDDDPARSVPQFGVVSLRWLPGDSADAEPDDDGEADPHLEGPWWPPAVGPADCGPAPMRAG